MPGVFSECLFAQCLFNDGLAGTVTDYEVVEYMLEVRNSANALLAYLPNWSGGLWTQEKNRPDILTFSYPAWDDNCAYFIRPNRIDLRDRTTGNWLQRFRILYSEIVSVGGKEYMHVEAESLLGQLAEEFVTEYKQTGYTLRQIVQGLLGFQDKTRQIHYQYADATIAASQDVWVTNKSPLKAIEQLQEIVGGWYWVTPARRFYWKQYRAGASTREFRRAKNMKGIRVERDYRNMATRLYAYGHGADRDTRLNLIHAGEANEWIRDVGAEAAYGVIAKVYENPECEDAAQLLAEAQYILSLHIEPEVRYKVDLVDLSKDKNYKRDFEHIEVGHKVLVRDDVLNISTTQDVVRVVRNLDLPFNIEVDLALPRKTLGQMIKALADRVDEIGMSDASAASMILSDTAPLDLVTTGGIAGTGSEASREDHEHGVDMGVGTSPILSDVNPLALGVVSPGAAEKGSRGDHRHPYEVYT